MYTFFFAVKTIEVTGDGTNPDYPHFPGYPPRLIPLESVLPSQTGEKVISFGPANDNRPDRAIFWSHIDEIDHGLGPAATVEDVIDWIYANTITPSVSFPASATTFDPTGTQLTGTNVQTALAQAGTDRWVDQGGIDCSANPNYPGPALVGFAYTVSLAGRIGGASGPVVRAGDVIYCTADNAGGTQAGVGNSWNILSGTGQGFGGRVYPYTTAKVGHAMHGSSQLWMDPFDPADSLHSSVTLTTRGTITGNLFGFPFMVRQTVTIDSARLNVVVAVAGSSLNLAIYNATQTTAVPTSKLADLMVNQSCASTGEKTATGLSVTLLAGTVYVMAIRTTASGISISAFNGNNLSTAFRNTGLASIAYWTGTDNATMPDPFPASPGSVTTSPWSPAIELGILTQ